jgi:hypothetical protein
MGIAISSDFDVEVTRPIDSRTVYTGIVGENTVTTADLNNIPNKYLGLIVYATGDRNLYVYQSGADVGAATPTWEKIVTTKIDSPPLITGNFIFNASFNGSVIYVSGSNTITGTLPSLGIPINPLGSGYNVSVVQLGDGNVIFRGGLNTFFRNRLDLDATAGKYAVASILRLNRAEFLLYGDLV